MLPHGAQHEWSVLLPHGAQHELSVLHAELSVLQPYGAQGELSVLLLLGCFGALAGATTAGECAVAVERAR